MMRKRRRKKSQNTSIFGGDDIQSPLSCGSFHCVFVDEQGTIFVWGSNGSGICFLLFLSLI